MAHRTFVDNAGQRWEVWSVVPVKVERRISGPRTVVSELENRRKKNEYRVRIGKTMVNGWLCFETPGEKRRLAPFPPGWDTLTDDELRRLCDGAALASPNARSPNCE